MLCVIGECGTMLTDHSGWFVAPDEDNDGLYDANVDCKWIIYVPRVDILRITIQNMDIQHYEDCELDYLEVSVLCPNFFKVGGGGAYCFGFVCPSVLLSLCFCVRSKIFS